MGLIERKIGETFEYKGKKIEVKAASSDECDGCFFNTKCTLKSRKLSGECDSDWRNDGKNVLFVEQQEKIEEIKERKVGEIFEYEGKKLKVEEKAFSDCYGCFFDEQHIPCSKNTLGYCGSEFCTDKKEVIFVEATEQNQMEQKLNLCEILKNCPQGETFWSPLLGDVKFYNVNQRDNVIYVTTKALITWKINADGTITIDDITSEEVMLYPSKEQRDWSKVKYEPREKKFNPNTLKPFDKIIARIDENGLWCCELFSFIEEGTNRIKGCGGYYKYCVPYNDDTMYLLNTANEVPEYYRYWEE